MRFPLVSLWPGRATLRVFIFPLLLFVIPLRGRVNCQRYVYIRILRMKCADEGSERIDRHRIEPLLQQRLEFLQQSLSFYVVFRSRFLRLDAFL